MFIRCGIMALIAAYLNFLSQMLANPAFCQYVSKVPAHTYTQLYTFLHFYCTNCVQVSGNKNNAKISARKNGHSESVAEA